MVLSRRKKKMKSEKIKIQEASFRDPCGFLYFIGEDLYRQINHVARGDYDLLQSSGLYECLAGKELMIGHQEVEVESPAPDKKYKTIKPERIGFISYPYEWSFSQLKDAALLTLEIQKIALDFGMTLKDASAYNVQFRKGKPVFIDTLSFERYKEGRPWVAYRQFCQHFLAPLALMGLKDVRLGQLMKNNNDGVPLDLASSLLPAVSWLDLNLLMHIHMHAKAQRKYSASSLQSTGRGLSLSALQGLIDSLQTAVRKLKNRNKDSEWAEYYRDTNYSQESFTHKRELVSDFLDEIRGGVVWDLGSNTGIFSRIAGEKGFEVISIDGDPETVERNYLQVRADQEKDILPLLIDLTNPSPDIGWSNEERRSLLKRGPADVVLALALVHHLAISNNLPLMKIGEFFSRICNWLIIEFIPKQDSQVKRLLASREDIFDEYDRNGFENAFDDFFEIQKAENIDGTTRSLYLMKKRFGPEEQQGRNGR